MLLLRILEIIIVVLFLRTAVTFVFRSLAGKKARAAEPKNRRFEAKGSRIADGEFRNL